MSATWEPVIGLEIHVQLKTRTKMFCRCALGFGAGENTQTCPVCLALPGALPVPNRHGDRVDDQARARARLRDRAARRLRPQELLLPRPAEGLPDLPVRSAVLRTGTVLVPPPDGEREVGIVRAHLEEDAAKTVHAGGATGRIGGADYSLVDFNRGGTPLLEIVTEPDIRSAEEAQALPAAAAADDRRARRLRRGDGEGHAARRRQRLGARRRARTSCARAGRSRT